MADNREVVLKFLNEHSGERFTLPQVMEKLTFTPWSAEGGYWSVTWDAVLSALNQLWAENKIQRFNGKNTDPFPERYEWQAVM